jgi:hypothetical protein
MASSSALNVASPLFGQVITEKLTKTNFPLWRAQVLPILRGAQLQGYLDGTDTPPGELEAKGGEKAKDGEKVKKVPNPDHAAWKAMEQQVLGFLMTSLSREVMAQVATLETPQRGVWRICAEVRIFLTCEDRQHEDRTCNDPQR